MRYPEFLSEGGTIGFVAPSFGCATEPYKTAFGMTIKRFEKEGYTIELGPNCYEDKGIGISNTPKACGKELDYKIEARRPGDIDACYADPKKAREELGFEAKRTLDDMCADTWRWQQQNPNGYEE